MDTLEWLGYSVKENVNNINVPHLHFGIQLIFDEVQKDGTNQIWIDVYQIIEFLRKNKSEVYRNTDTYEFYRKYNIIDPSIPKEKYIYDTNWKNFNSKYV